MVNLHLFELDQKRDISKLDQKVEPAYHDAPHFIFDRENLSVKICNVEFQPEHADRWSSRTNSFDITIQNAMRFDNGLLSWVYDSYLWLI